MISSSVMQRWSTRYKLLICVSLIFFVGCATKRINEIPHSDPRVANAMAYARNLLKTTEPKPVKWYTQRGTYKAPDGMWCYKSSWGNYYAGGQTQFLDSYTRVVIYVGPNGEQLDVVWPHEAVHAVGRDIIDHSKDHHPEKTKTGIKLKGVVPYW